MRLMGQPIDQERLQSVLLTLEEVEKMNPPPDNVATATAGEGGAMITEQSAAVSSST